MGGNPWKLADGQHGRHCGRSSFLGMSCSGMEVRAGSPSLLGLARVLVLVACTGRGGVGAFLAGSRGRGGHLRPAGLAGRRSPSPSRFHAICVTRRWRCLYFSGGSGRP
jgi:hypothetical protein